MELDYNDEIDIFSAFISDETNGYSKEAYYSDGRGRYGTGESFDYFFDYDGDDSTEILTSSDGIWTYVIFEEGIKILRYNSHEINIEVPAQIDGKDVVAMDSVFDNFFELKSAVIPKGVISIVGVFYGCENLEQVTLPEGILDMEYAFNSCFSLKQIEIPSTVKYFSNAFGNTSIEHIIFPPNTENIYTVFAGSETLKSVFLPKSIRDMDEAFSDCEVLTQVTIEEGVQKIDEWAFYHCPALLELEIPESVVKIEAKSVGYMEIRENLDGAYRSKGEQIVPGFRIKGHPGSAAEKYAKENGIEFIEKI